MICVFDDPLFKPAGKKETDESEGSELTIDTASTRQKLDRAECGRTVSTDFRRPQGLGTKGQKIGIRMLATIQRRILSGAPIFGKSDPTDRVSVFVIPVGKWSDGSPDTEDAGSH